MLNQQIGYPVDWAQLTPEQKREWRLNNFLNPKNLQFVSEKAKNDYRVRAQRWVDVYNVKEPDRVPVNLPVGNLAYTNYGINYRTAMYDYEKAVAACKKFNEEFSEELEYWASPWVTPGRVLELLDYKLYSWPGHRLGENVSSVQFMESEYMKADEYDAFIPRSVRFLDQNLHATDFRGAGTSPDVPSCYRPGGNSEHGTVHALCKRGRAEDAADLNGCRQRIPEDDEGHGRGRAIGSR